MEDKTHIPVIILVESKISEHFQEDPEFEIENIERCPNCGSSLFRIYHEPVPEGTYEQKVCAVCNHRMGGFLDNWKEIYKNNEK